MQEIFSRKGAVYSGRAGGLGYIILFANRSSLLLAISKLKSMVTLARP